MITKLSWLTLLLLVSTAAFGFPLPHGQRPFVGQPATSTLYDFEGIIALSNCSGSLVKLESSKPTDQALVLTNGHCVSFRMIPPGQFIYKRPVRRSFDIFNSRGLEVGQVNAIELLYATMTTTDLALYRLRETYQEIESKLGVRPFIIQRTRPEVGQSLQVISGYWKRGYSCEIEAIVHTLKEDSWIMNESIRYTRPGCEVIGGTSGSPIIATGTRTVIGVNNTGNEDGGRCTTNNPCEIDDKGNVEFQMGYSYGQQTYTIYSCLTVSGDFDLNLPNCSLPR